MIQQYATQEGKTQYKVRVFLRSNINARLRVTRQQGSIDSEAQAQKIEAQLKKECEREIQSLEAQGVQFGELAEDWHQHYEKIKVATSQRSKTTHDDYLGGIRKWFQNYWREPASKVTPYVVIEVFETMKQKGVCFGHRKKLKQVLKSIFDFGIQSGELPYLQRSPTFEVALKREEEKKPEILTLDELQKLLTKAYEIDHDWKRVWSVALLTGMRSGELYALRWDDVNFDNKLINVNKSYNCRKREFKSTKAGYWRQMPISKELELVLKDQKKQTEETEYVFARNWEWDKGLQAKVLRRFCYIQQLPSIKFHTLRACFATQMLRAGVEPAKVMKICGWKELKTMQRYIRLAGIDVQGVTEGLNIFPVAMNLRREGSAVADPSFLKVPKVSNPEVTS